MVNFSHLLLTIAVYYFNLHVFFLLAMDQNKTDVPHFMQPTKKTCNLPTLPTHLTGVIVHGFGSFAYFDHKEFGRGANLTATVFLRTLNEIFESEKYRKLQRKPRHLYIQVRNSNVIRTYSYFPFSVRQRW